VFAKVALYRRHSVERCSWEKVSFCSANRTLYFYLTANYGILQQNGAHDFDMSLDFSEDLIEMNKPVQHL
jgi:hypothetical protein